MQIAEKIEFSMFYKKPVTRIELVTSPLPRVCSTTEPHGQNLDNSKF